MELVWKMRLPLLGTTTSSDILWVFSQLLPDKRPPVTILFVGNTLHPKQSWLSESNPACNETLYQLVSSFRIPVLQACFEIQLSGLSRFP